jgi:hypothetical protein
MPPPIFIPLAFSGKSLSSGGGTCGGLGGLLPSPGGSFIGVKIGFRGGSNPGACPNLRGLIICALLKLLSLDGCSYGVYGFLIASPVYGFIGPLGGGAGVGAGLGAGGGSIISSGGSLGGS